MLSLIQAAEATPAKIQPMSTMGWIFMIGSVSFVVVLTAWCFYRVLTAPKELPEGIDDFHSA